MPLQRRISFRRRSGINAALRALFLNRPWVQAEMHFFQTSNARAGRKSYFQHAAIPLHRAV